MEGKGERWRRGLALDLQTCGGVAVWIGCRIVGDRLNDSRRVHVYCQKGFTKAGVLCIYGVHVVHCANERRNVDLIEI